MSLHPPIGRADSQGKTKTQQIGKQCWARELLTIWCLWCFGRLVYICLHLCKMVCPSVFLDASTHLYIGSVRPFVRHAFFQWADYGRKWSKCSKLVLKSSKLSQNVHFRRIVVRTDLFFLHQSIIEKSMGNVRESSVLQLLHVWKWKEKLKAHHLPQCSSKSLPDCRKMANSDASLSERKHRKLNFNSLDLPIKQTS